MDSTSIITQVNRDEEPLNAFPTADSGEFYRDLPNILLCKRPLKRPWFVDRKKVIHVHFCLPQNSLVYFANIQEILMRLVEYTFPSLFV